MGLTLPNSSLRVRSSPTKQTGLSSFEILYGQLLSLTKDLTGNLNELGDFILKQKMPELDSVIVILHQWANE